MPAPRVLPVGRARAVPGPRADGRAGVAVQRAGESDGQGSDEGQRSGDERSVGGQHHDPPELCRDAVPVSEPGVLHVLRDRAHGVGDRFGALELCLVWPAVPPGDVHRREEAVHLLRE